MTRAAGTSAAALDVVVGARLRAWEQRGLLHAPAPTERMQVLCGNDYLGLATHPDVIAASQQAIAADGAGAQASRLVSGTLARHVAVE